MSKIRDFEGVEEPPCELFEIGREKYRVAKVKLQNGKEYFIIQRRVANVICTWWKGFHKHGWSWYTADFSGKYDRASDAVDTINHKKGEQILSTAPIAANGTSAKPKASHKKESP